MDKIRKNLVLVKPYDPNPEVNWLDVSLDTTTLGMRFADPQVQSEFVVFMHRDLIMIMISAVWASACIVLPLPRVVVLGDYAWIDYACAVLLSTCLLADVYIYFIAELTPKICRVRRAVQLVSTVPMAACCCLAPFVAYQQHNCVQATDMADLLYLRPTPSFTKEEIGWFCSQTMEPFSIAVVTMGYFALPFPPFLMVPLWIMALVLLMLARPLYPNHDYEAPAELGVKSLLTIFICVAMAIINMLRFAMAQRQFKLALKVKKETMLSEKQEEDIDLLLQTMLPATALERLGRGQRVADYTDEATVLFSDMVSFTAWSSTRTAHEVVVMLNAVCRGIDMAAANADIEKIKTIGDAYWAVSGLPSVCKNHAEKVCDFGNEMLDVVVHQNKQHPEWNGINLRIGVHSGPLNGGILGTQQLSYEVWGDTCSLANKAEQNGTPARVAASRDTLESIGLDPGGLASSNTIPFSCDPDEKRVIDLFALNRTTVQKMIAERNLLEEPAQADKLAEQPKQKKSVLSPLSPPNSKWSVVSPKSMRSSRSVYSPAELKPLTSEEAKKNRAKLLASRAAARSELGIEEEQEEDMEVLIARYSKRRWSWIFQDYADPEVEAEFFEFVKDRQINVRTLTRILMLPLVFCIGIGVLIQGGTFSTASGICFLVALFCGAWDLAFCFMQPDLNKNGSGHIKQRKPVSQPTLLERVWIKRWKGQAVLNHIVCVLIFLGAGLMGGGQSAGTNDITYLHSTLTCIVGAGNVGLVSSAALMVANLSILVPLMLWLISPVVMLGTHAVFLGQANLAIFFTLVIMEKQYRSQFLQRHVALYMQARQVKRGKEREALLASMVPDHIVGDLMAWMVKMDRSQMIVQKLPMVVVGFIQTYQPVSETPAFIVAEPAVIEREAFPASSTTPLADAGGGGSSRGGNPLATTETKSPQESNPNIEASDEDDEEGMEMEPRTPQSPVVALSAEHWLQVIHNQIDSMLKSFVAVSKIKSIGDYVMLAGPFVHNGRPQGDVSEACDDMLAAASSIRAIAPCRVGIHVGELVGAVIGTSRLCYDIFGDTVNTASRTMTSGGKGDMSVSEEFYQAHPVHFATQHRERIAKQREADINDGGVVVTCLDRQETVTNPDTPVAGGDDGEKAEGGGECTKDSNGMIPPIPEPTKEESQAHVDSSLSPSRLKRSKLKDWQTAEATFSEEPEKLHAKGKGTILVRKVLTVPPIEVATFGKSPKKPSESGLESVEKKRRILFSR